MAHAALVSLAQTIDLILNYHQHCISPEVEDEIISINEYIVFLQAFLEGFPDKANSLEGIIREATHAAEDIIELSMLEQVHESRYGLIESSVGPSESKFDHQLWESLRQIHESRNVLVKSTAGPSKSVECKDQQKRREKIRSSLAMLRSTFRLSKSKFKYQRKEKCEHLHELNKITKQIESIAEKMMEIKNSDLVKDKKPRDSTAASSSSRVAPIHKETMVGFDDDLMEIISRLRGESSKRQVIPIVGMGGIGRTTLARNAYDDPLIMERFEIRAWVTVSQDYSAQEIASGLLVSLNVFNAQNESMKDKVYQNVKGRRYLIVLDDIWSINAWDDLQMMFPDDGDGSRIMLTTRLSDVACYPDSYSPVHVMRLMDENKSWDLLRWKVFKQGPCPDELEQVGKMITRSCRGLPLAIVVISGMLAVDQTEDAWWNIVKNINSAISTNYEQYNKILSLSYTHLPHHLRPCFLYMGGFPEDYEMHVSRLIRLWVAEGFVKPTGRDESFEETAEEYLEDLARRSLVLVTGRKSDGRIKSFSIHDLLREMCVRKAEEENLFLHVRASSREEIKILRRVSFTHSDLDILENNADGLTIRTIIRLKDRRLGTRCSLGYFILLRVLDLSSAFDFFLKNHRSSIFLPAEVFELFHLRYLAFDHPFRIPGAISNLQNLQTLVIRLSEEKYSGYEPVFVELPVEIWRMPQLRHLILFCLLPSHEGARSALENLQTLSVVRNFACAQDILTMIPNLKKLGIVYRGRRYDDNIYAEDYQLHNLVYLQQLENLKLKIHRDFPCPEKVKPAFPTTLKKLTLSRLQLHWDDMTIIGSLPNLEVLKLRDHAFVGEVWETMEGEFPQLKFLLIEESYLNKWITESSHFPILECLVLHGCGHLRGIPADIGEIPTLELIMVSGLIRKSLADSVKQIRDDQESSGNDALRIRCDSVSILEEIIGIDSK